LASVEGAEMRDKLFFEMDFDTSSNRISRGFFGSAGEVK
jgi:hypothetical protein